METVLASLQCPHCGSDFVRRIRPQTPSEYLLRLVHIYPFQCQVCAHRFTKYQTEEQRATAAPDRRDYVRLPTALRATISGTGREGEGVASDLSLDGCSLRTTLKLEVGEQFRLSLQPQGDSEPIVVERAVVRSVKPPLVGMQFVQFSARGRERLSRLVRALLADQQASA